MALDLSALDVPSAPVPPRWVAPVAPLSAFEEDPGNPRFEEEGEEFDTLVEDVRQRGILQPVVVRPMPSGMLQLRFGRRRYRAACALQLPGLSYVVTEDPRQFDDYAQVAENQKHKLLQPLEMAVFIARKVSQGERKKEVAARLALDASAVTHLLALVSDPPPVLLELYHSRRCRTPQYLYDLRRLWALQPALVEARIAADDAIDRQWLVRLASEVRGRLSPAGAATAPQRDTAPAAAAVVPTAHEQTPEETRQMTRLRQPRLRGCYCGRALRVVLERMPSREGLIWVHFDGEGEPVEVDIGTVQLTALQEAGSGRLRLVHAAEDALHGVASE